MNVKSGHCTLSKGIRDVVSAMAFSAAAKVSRPIFFLGGLLPTWTLRSSSSLRCNSVCPGHTSLLSHMFFRKLWNVKKYVPCAQQVFTAVEPTSALDFRRSKVIVLRISNTEVLFI